MGGFSGLTALASRLGNWEDVPEFIDPVFDRRDSRLFETVF